MCDRLENGVDLASAIEQHLFLLRERLRKLYRPSPQVLFDLVQRESEKLERQHALERSQVVVRIEPVARLAVVRWAEHANRIVIAKRAPADGRFAGKLSGSIQAVFHQAVSSRKRVYGVT